MQSTTTNNDKKPQTQLQHYLNNIDWDNKTFTEYQLRTILGAACARYLGGVTNIEFVFDLSEEIRKKQYKDLTPQFKAATDALHDLAEQTQTKDNNSPATKNMMHVIIQHVQKALTGIPLVIN